MKVKLYAKRLDGRGHVYLNTVDIPEGRMEWLVPVRQPLDVSFKDGGEMAPAHTHDAVRVFRYQHDPITRGLRDLPRFLEE